LSINDVIDIFQNVQIFFSYYFSVDFLKYILMMKYYKKKYKNRIQPAINSVHSCHKLKQQISITLD